ncbi:11799_t:CDS:2 [Entrophospora sp. SA101]|nr:11799_t:CDS:2 [Entrophospora sp. SA101]
MSQCNPRNALYFHMLKDAWSECMIIHITLDSAYLHYDGFRLECGDWKEFREKI